MENFYKYFSIYGNSLTIIKYKLDLLIYNYKEVCHQ